MYGLAYELPNQESWDNGIRHVFGCLLVDPQGGRLTGTAQGSGRKRHPNMLGCPRRWRWRTLGS